MRYYSKGYPQGLQGSPTSVTTSCISCVHASPNLQVYVLNDRSCGLKTPEHVSSQFFFFAKNGDPTSPRKCYDTTVMILTCEKIPEYKICEEIYQKHRTIRNNNKYFIIQKGKQCSLASSRGKGLCYYCDEKYSSGHKQKEPKFFQIDATDHNSLKEAPPLFKAS